MLTLQIGVVEELFHFIHFNDWINHAAGRFRNHGHSVSSTVCVDAKGQICLRGKHFKEATYPVRVYAIEEPAPYRILAEAVKPDVVEEVDYPGRRR